MKVLIVEDNPISLFTMRQHLGVLGEYDISGCEDAETALTLFLEDPCELLILDLGLPGMDGFECARHLRTLPGGECCYILVITAFDRPEDLQKALDAGADDYMVKPVGMEALRVRLTIIERQLKNCLQRRLAEQKVLAQNEFLENVLESLTHPFCVLDPKNYTLLMANSAAGGKTLIRSRHCYQGLHGREEPCAGPDHLCPLQEIKLHHKPVIVEHLHVNEDGEFRYVEVHSFPVFDASQQLVQVIEYALDIHERKLAEEALRKSERQYRLLAEYVADGIGILQDEKLVFVNEALASMLGFAATQLLGNPLLDVVRDDYKLSMQQAHRELAGNKDGSQWQVLQCIVRRDGRELWIEGYHSTIEWEGAPAILMTMRDISEHKLRELEIEGEKERFRLENIQLKTSMKERYRFGKLVGKSAAMQEVYTLILEAAASDANIIISGESGTGKELIAHEIHRLGERRANSFLAVNCGAIQESLFESEFFGHQKGAFTGAYRKKNGFFDLTRGGTLFLDELGELSPLMQVKLLRAIEEEEYIPVGGERVKQSNVRIIAATNRDLFEQLQQGSMREDFFYRMYVVAIEVPPLRRRREDIPLLVDYFLNKFSREQSPPALSGNMLNALYDYDWPGNVRELQNTIQRFLTTKRLDFIGQTKLSTFSPRNMQEPFMLAENDAESLALQETLESVERRIILRALQQNQWNKSKSAKHLGITRRSLLRRIDKYQLNPHNV